jgi:hypothetical protein
MSAWSKSGRMRRAGVLALARIGGLHHWYFWSVAA